MLRLEPGAEFTVRGSDSSLSDSVLWLAERRHGPLAGRRGWVEHATNGEVSFCIDGPAGEVRARMPWALFELLVDVGPVPARRLPRPTTFSPHRDEWPASLREGSSP